MHVFRVLEVNQPPSMQMLIHTRTVVEVKNMEESLYYIVLLALRRFGDNSD